MKIADIPGGSAFVDTNILLYAYTSTPFSPSCEAFLERVQSGKIRGFVNPTVIDEFFHKLLLTNLFMERHLVPKDAIAYIKQNPDRLHEFHQPFEMTKELLGNFGLVVLDTSGVLTDALDISQKFGLLFSDALHAACARRNCIDYFVTNDHDFDRVDFLTVVRP
ncbi:PilT protein domain protein [Methanoregula boonei 6A8]|jgi:hypothetical protein|uniref:PilT protein domain protein n=1 Tax=Methanoregula boonei (strain DSM 21154 / JCM 14090 / 6A8) TaxID=456442 RepID=A7I980_METB6|nr:type II toxin-antitoxin system VapC family toxin [Methanoregula boonei]ABS56291.1 PilT protein domain protein [Methanoregula boonei 6A8]